MKPCLSSLTQFGSRPAQTVLLFFLLSATDPKLSAVYLQYPFPSYENDLCNVDFWKGGLFRPR